MRPVWASSRQQKGRPLDRPLPLTGEWEVVPDLAVEVVSPNDTMSEVVGKPVRFQQIPLEAFKADLLKRGMSAEFAQGYADMLAAKNEGLDNAEPRTAENATPTSFRQWCAEVLRPAVLA